MDAQKYDRLLELLTHDEIYQIYDQSWNELLEQLQAMEKKLPLETRRLLWGLAQTAQTRQCRALLLACGHMEFQKE